MARRTSRSNNPAEATAEATTNEESAVSTATPEAEASTENTEAAKAEVEVDFTAFHKAVADAVEAADDTTGEVPEANIAAVTTEYRTLTGVKAKNAAKAYVNEQMKEAMNPPGDLARARASMQIAEKALVAGASKSSGDRAPADPTENFVQRIATLNLAYNLATANVPEGVSEGWSDKVSAQVGELTDQANSYFAWTQADAETRGDEPEVSSVVRNAAKLATGKAAKAGTSRGGGTFTGDRHDIGQHIEHAFSDKEEGTFLTISEIRNIKSPEYGDQLPSAGAISARLFPKSGKSTMEKVGIVPDTADNGKKGARKVAVAE